MKKLLTILLLLLIYESNAKPKKVTKTCIGMVIGAFIGYEITKPVDNAWLWGNYTKIDPNRPKNKSKIIGMCVGAVIGGLLIHFPYKSNTDTLKNKTNIK